MELDKKLMNIEQERNINKAIQYLEEDKNKNLNTYLRVIFLLLDFLVDSQYTQEEHNFISLKIKDLFEEAKTKYFNESEFLFFSGMMIYIAEWYFGIKTLDDAKTMLNKAMQCEPNNIVYKWGYYCIPDQRPEINTEIKFSISKQILESETLIQWIKNRGLLGDYLIGIIQGTYDASRLFI